MWDAIANAILGDKSKGWQRELRCPFFLCPSNQPFPGAYPPRMKFVQKLGPGAHQYRCRGCSCLTNVSIEKSEDGRETWKVNPALIGQKPSYMFWKR